MDRAGGPGSARNPPWAQGRMAAQLFDSGIMTVCAQGRLLVPYTSLYEEKHYYHRWV